MPCNSVDVWQRRCIWIAVGSFSGQILEYDNESDRSGSDVERLVSEVDGRLRLEAIGSDGNEDEDDDDDDADDAQV